MRGGPNGLGSVASVLSGGSVSAAYSYTPWGKASGAGELPFVGYRSQEHAGDGTGLQHLRARFYDAASAAFPTADSYLGDPSDPSTMNRYAYCGGNPVAFSDPSGNAAVSKAKALGSAAKWSVLSAAPGASAAARAAASAVPGVAAAARAVRAAAGLGRGDGWTRAPAPSGGFFGAAGDFLSGAASYASEQVRRVQEHVCGAADYIKDQVGKFLPPDLSGKVHGALDILGFWPGVGVGADILNGVLYAVEGEWGDAAASFVGAVPGFGDGVKAGYMGVKAGKGLGKMAEAFLAADIADYAKTIQKSTRTANAAGASKLLPGSDLVEVKAFNKAGTLRREVHEDGTVDLILKKKDIWDTDQIRQAGKKADALTEGNTVKTVVGKRSKTAAEEYKKLYEGKMPTGYDIDHIIELQLGGADDVSNMWLLDRSVNRSMGAQISILIRDLPPGTRIGNVRFE